jgi:Tetracyclin repressor-like, C-terminal domain
VFRADLEPLDLHASISAQSFFDVFNQYTSCLVFERDMQQAQPLIQHFTFEAALDGWSFDALLQFYGPCHSQ